MWVNAPLRDVSWNAVATARGLPQALKIDYARIGWSVESLSQCEAWISSLAQYRAFFFRVSYSLFCFV